MPKKTLTNEEVDRQVKNADKKAIRISNYIGRKKKIEWKCPDCNNIWLASLDCIMASKYGCPNCYGNTKLTNADVDKIIEGRPVKRLASIDGNKNKIPWQCLVEGCGFVWEACPSSIYNVKSGCPNCAGLVKLDNNIVDERIKDRPLKRIGNYINLHTKILWQCLMCNNIWNTTPANIIHNNRGCPKCANNIKYSNEEIDAKTEPLKIKRMEDYNGANKKIKWLHTECNFEWLAKPDHIINSKSGCPKCKNSNEKLIYNILIENNIPFEYHKKLKDFGIDCPNYIVDYYITSINLIIEYNGEQHYEAVKFGGISQEEAQKKLEKQTKRDLKVDELCSNSNINIIWIDGRKYKGEKLKKYLLDTIIPYITLFTK